MEYCFIGIDPGKTGGIAAISQDKKIIHLRELAYSSDGYPDPSYLLGYLSSMNQRYNIFIVLEETFGGVMQKGITGKLISYGVVLACVKINTSNYKIVTGKEWTKNLFPESSKLDYTDRKKRNAHEAQRLFPAWKPKSVEEIVAYSDALLLACYSRSLKAQELKNKIRPEDIKPVLPKKSVAMDFFSNPDINLKKKV